ncbi:YggT family protein [Alkalispirillum mobile]|uniref:YggT family protein n=1 Tax=Alkalispirillum mobile TaxID=85925 RepID=A0A498CGE6_9GAMM|nr:YggT family protein [Alkalispirillum mobile]RLK51408.1 YggT family protein [Alkalispirillum mobile]
MDGYLANPVTFLLETLITLYILAVMVRFLLQWARADFFNPISQAVVKVTQPTLSPLRRVIPGYRGLDLAAVVLMIALQTLSLYLTYLIGGSYVLPVGYALMSAVIQVLSLLFTLYTVIIIIQVIMSWVNPHSHHPGVAILHSLSEPVLSPIRRMLPDLGGLDLSPLVALLGIQVLRMLIFPPLHALVPPLTG